MPTQSQKNSEEIISIPDDEKVEDAGFSDVELNLFQNKENKTQPNTFA